MFDKTFPTLDCATILTPKMAVGQHERIDLITNAG
jgi:heterodisulfide reductase subunit A-like polyferredoxin